MKQIALVVLGAVLFVSMTTERGTALSCAVHPNGRPEAILRGTEELASEQGFIESYDGAIIGEVIGIETNEVHGSETFGRTVTGFAVDAAFWNLTGSVVMVTSDDPGWFAGYPFEMGKRYFVPLVLLGPQGQPMYSMVCDPITPVNLRRVDRLTEIARANEVPIVMPSQATAPSATEADAGPVPDESPPWLVAGATLAGVVAIGIAGFLAARSKRQAQPDH
jgi:hypothetical protein